MYIVYFVTIEKQVIISLLTYTIILMSNEFIPVKKKPASRWSNFRSYLYIKEEKMTKIVDVGVT